MKWDGLSSPLSFANWYPWSSKSGFCIAFTSRIYRYLAYCQNDYQVIEKLIKSLDTPAGRTWIYFFDFVFKEGFPEAYCKSICPDLGIFAKFRF